jgi:hypothetical protein
MSPAGVGQRVEEPSKMATALLPFVVLAIVVALDAWVYFDAAALEQRGTPVVFSYGAFVVDTPRTWAVCCLVLSSSSRCISQAASGNRRAIGMVRIATL